MVLTYPKYIPVYFVLEVNQKYARSGHWTTYTRSAMLARSGLARPFLVDVEMGEISGYLCYEPCVRRSGAVGHLFVYRLQFSYYDVCNRSLQNHTNSACMISLQLKSTGSNNHDLSTSSQSTCTVM